MEDSARFISLGEIKDGFGEVLDISSTNVFAWILWKVKLNIR